MQEEQISSSFGPIRLYASKGGGKATKKDAAVNVQQPAAASAIKPLGPSLVPRLVVARLRNPSVDPSSLLTGEQSNIVASLLGRG